MYKKTISLSFLAVCLLATSFLAVGCRGTQVGSNEPVTGYSTSAPTIQPTAVPGFPPQPDPKTAIKTFYATFNDTNTLVGSRARYEKMYTLMLPSSNACDEDRFIALMLDIKAVTGVYNTIDLPDPTITGDQATMTVNVSTVFGRDNQIFSLVKQDGGWLIKGIVDKINGESHNWPPQADASWQSTVNCGSSTGAGQDSTPAVTPAATATPLANYTTSPNLSLASGGGVSLCFKVAGVAAARKSGCWQWE